MDVRERVERFILDELLMRGDGGKRLDPEESLITTGVLDSLALLRLVLFLEEQFGITVEDGDLVPGNFQNLNTIQAFVQSKL